MWTRTAEYQDSFEQARVGLDRGRAAGEADLHGAALGFLGEKGVNVLELNLAMDKLTRLYRERRGTDHLMDTAQRILVVDDGPRIRTTLEVNLRVRGYTADLTVTGEQALQLATRHHPDLVVLDLGLPARRLDVIRGLRGWTENP